MIDHFISHIPPGAPTDRQHGKASWCKWGAGLKGLAYGGYSSNKKHRNKRPQLEAPLDAGRNKGSYCEIFEHFLMYFKLLNSPIIFHIPVFNEEHHS